MKLQACCFNPLMCSQWTHNRIPAPHWGRPHLDPSHLSPCTASQPHRSPHSASDVTGSGPDALFGLKSSSRILAHLASPSVSSQSIVPWPCSPGQCPTPALLPSVLSLLSFLARVHGNPLVSWLCLFLSPDFKSLENRHLVCLFHHCLPSEPGT